MNGFTLSLTVSAKHGMRWALIENGVEVVAGFAPAARVAKIQGMKALNSIIAERNNAPAAGYDINGAPR